jgi:hypothetical protein
MTAGSHPHAKLAAESAAAAKEQAALTRIQTVEETDQVLGT